MSNYRCTDPSEQCSQCTFPSEICTHDHPWRIYKIGKIEEMEIENDELHDENHELYDECFDLMNEITEKDDTISVLTSENDELKKCVNELHELSKLNHERAQFMQGVIDKLKEDAEMQEEMMPHRPSLLVRLEQANQDLDDENRLLSKRVAHLQQEIDAHASEQESSQQEIARLDKARREAETKLGDHIVEGFQQDETIIQLLADNVEHLAQLKLAHREKTDLEARSLRLYLDSCRLQRCVDELQQELQISLVGNKCSRQSCIDTQTQLLSTQAELVTSQKQCTELELTIQSINQSNNELQNLIGQHRSVVANQTDRITALNQDIEQMGLHFSSMRLKQSIDQNQCTQNIVQDLFNRYEKIESMLDAADAANESLEFTNMKLKIKLTSQRDLMRAMLILVRDTL